MHESHINSYSAALCVCVNLTNILLLEVAILWAAHQVHHSSEYYNLTTALRQSLTQQFTSWVRPLFILLK